MNIPGIEILNKTEIIEESLNNGLVVMTLTLFLFGLIFLLFASATDEDGLGFTGLILFALALLMLVISGVFPDKNPTGRYEYELLVSDEADVRQLYEEYEIVEVRVASHCYSKIYIVRDFEPETSTDSCCNCNTHSHRDSAVICPHHKNVFFDCQKEHNPSNREACSYQKENVLEKENPETEPIEKEQAIFETTKNVCIICNTFLNEEDNFCPHCGNKRKEN